MASQSEPRIQPAEYLERERRAETRSEFLNGEVFAMAGASREHGLVTGNVFASLHGQLRPRDCEIYASDMRVHVSATGLYTYPDIVAVCGEPRFQDDELDTLLNPTLIVEVFSPSTEDYDRGTKFAHYRAIGTLREVLLLPQDRAGAEHYVRQDGDGWLITTTQDPMAVLSLPSIGATLDLSEAFAGVPMEQPYSLEAERAVLATVLLEPDLLTRVSERLGPDDFYPERHRRIFEAMGALAIQEIPIDLQNLIHRLEQEGDLDDLGGTSYLQTLDLDLPDRSRIDSYVDVVEHWAQRRRAD